MEGQNFKNKMLNKIKGTYSIHEKNLIFECKLKFALNKYILIFIFINILSLFSR